MIKVPQDVTMNRVREKENHNTKSCIKYLSKNMYMIHCLTYSYLFFSSLEAVTHCLIKHVIIPSSRVVASIFNNNNNLEN